MAASYDFVQLDVFTRTPLVPVRLQGVRHAYLFKRTYLVSGVKPENLASLRLLDARCFA
jgi:hypothetical protein